jgi:hypothetical protein
MNHLTTDELVDAVDDALASDRLAHLASCAGCRDKVDQLASVLSEARIVDVAEPSPLFWDHLSKRVHQAIATEPTPTRWLPRWVQWPVLVPITAMAVLIFTLASAVPRMQLTDARTTMTRATQTTPEQGDDEAARAADADWVLISDLLGNVDFETAAEAGLVAAPGVADQAVLLLSATEQQELVRLLQQELKVGG